MAPSAFMIEMSARPRAAMTFLRAVISAPGGLHDRPRLLLPGVLHLREGLLDPLLRRAGVLDGVVEVPVFEMQFRLREGRPGLVPVDPPGPRIVDPPVRAVHP